MGDGRQRETTDKVAQTRAAALADALARINEILLSAITPDALLGRLVDDVSVVAGAEKCVVIRVEDDTYTITHVREVPDDVVGRRRDAEAYPAFALAAREQHPILIGDTARDPRTNKAFVVPYGLGAFQLIPIVVEGKAGAVLALAWSGPRVFDEADTAFAERMSTAMSMAMANATLYVSALAARREAQRELSFTNVLLKAAGALAETSDTEALLTRLADILLESSSHTRVTVDRWDNLREELTVVVSRGEKPVPCGTYGRDDLSPAAREAIETRNPMLIDYEDAPASTAKRAARLSARLGLVAPIVYRENVLGIILVDAPGERREFSQRESALIAAIADQAAIAIANARLLEAERQTTGRLTDVLDSMTEGFISLDRDWRYTMVNPRMADMIHRRPEELLGRSMLEEYPDASGIPYFRRAMEEHEPQVFEVWSAITERWLEVHAFPTAEGISILFSDVSERKRTEQRIRQHARIEEGIGTILQASLTTETEEALGEKCLDVAVRITDSAYGFIDEIGTDGLLHDVAVSDTGWEACAMYDKSGHRRRPGDFKIHGLYGKVFAEARPFYTNEPSERPESIGTPEGHPRLDAFLGVPLFSGDRALGVLNVANKEGGYTAQDARALEAIAPVVVEAFQRKRAERETVLAKERLDAHIDNSPLAVIEFDGAFRITRWSDEAEKMFGWSAEEVLGKGMRELKWIYEEDMASVDEEAGRLLTAAHPRSLNVNRNYRKGGEVIWCEWYDSAIYDDEGRMVSILSQVLDVTERKQAEEALARTIARMALLADSARLLLTTETPECVVQRIAEQVMEFLGCEVFFNYLVDEDDEDMHLNAYAGISAEEAGDIATLEMGAAVCGCVARDGIPIVVDDVQRSADPRTELVKSFGVQAYACHPLISQGETIGTLSFGSRTRTRFQAEELDLMRVVADQAATAMARRRAEDRTRSSEQRYRQLFANMLDGFAYCRMEFDDAGRPWDFVYLDVNDVFSELTGLHDVVGKRVSEVIPGVRESNPEVLEAYGRVAAGGPSEHLETELDQLGRAFSIGVYSPMPGHFVAIFHNVTEQKTRERFDQSLDEIRTAVGATLEPAEIIHEIADRAAETLGTDVRQVIMRSGNAWTVIDSRGAPAFRVGETLPDEALPISNSAIAERRPIAQVDEGGRATRRRSAMRRFGVGSILIVPLLAQGRGIGVIAFGHVPPVPFTEIEQYFATRLTSIAALTLDNAFAYEREHAIADALQEAVLSPPAAISGIESAYLYRAASAEAAVGGDFYDIFELDRGKVGLLVGDVSGKGLEAARLTSLVRDGARAYALERDDPAWVLSRVNELMFRSSPVEAFATVFFGVLDVLSGELRYTAAGHPAAVMCLPEGPRFLEETPSALVGAFEVSRFSEGSAHLGRDDVLVLYTDGVIEARGKDGMYGESRLLDTLARLKGVPLGLLPQAVLDDVLGFSGGSLRDDTVIVCVRRSLVEERA